MKILQIAFAAAVAAAVSGCATHTSETADMRRAWLAGDTARAGVEVDSVLEDKKGGGDELVWRLECGAVARADGDLKKSAEELEAAHSAVRGFESESETRLSEETEAFLTNRSFIPYKGYNYDKIMMGVYLALDYIEQKDFDRARVQLKRLENYQKNAVQLNRARIERETENLEKSARKTAAQNRDSARQNVSGAMRAAAASPEFRRHYGDAIAGQKFGQQAKSLYVNPFAYWVTGVYFANRGEDSADRQLAQDMFRIGGEVLGGKSEVFAADYARCEDIVAGKPAVGITYVVYETGCAPLRRQFRLDLPLFAVGRNLPHVAVNFPYLEPQNSYKPDISIVAGGKKYSAETVADMDAIIQEEFDNELALVVTKTLLSAAGKAAAQYFAAQAAGDFGVLVNIGGAIYQSLTNDADLRTWTTLPKQIKIARMETPADGVVTVDGTRVEVAPNAVNIIFAKRTGAAGRLILRKFDFSDAPKSAAVGSVAAESSK